MRLPYLPNFYGAMTGGPMPILPDLGLAAGLLASWATVPMATEYLIIGVGP